MIVERSQADTKRSIVMAALEAAVYIDSSDAPAAALALVKGLMAAQLSFDLLLALSFVGVPYCFYSCRA